MQMKNFILNANFETEPNVNLCMENIKPEMKVYKL